MADLGMQGKPLGRVIDAMTQGVRALREWDALLKGIAETAELLADTIEVISGKKTMGSALSDGVTEGIKDPKKRAQAESEIASTFWTSLGGGIVKRLDDLVLGGFSVESRMKSQQKYAGSPLFPYAGDQNKTNQNKVVEDKLSEISMKIGESLNQARNNQQQRPGGR